MARPISTYSIVACDLDQGEWGVAVQSKFLAVGSVVPWAEAEVGAVATQAYANPRYGPDGLALAAAGALGRGGRQAPDRGRRRPRRAAARRRRRRRPRRHVHRLRLPRLGGRPDGLRLRRPGEHPRLRRDGGRARGDVRGDRGLAGRAAAGEPRGGSGRRRRQPRPAVGFAARRQARRRLRGPVGRGRRPTSGRPRGSDRGAAPPVRPPRPALRQDAPRPVADLSTTSSAPRSTSAWPSSATSVSRTGPAPRTWRSGSTATRRSTRWYCAS